MNELINNIILYAKEHHRFAAPELQSELQIGYREFSDVLKALQGNGTLKFVGGMIYEYSAESKTDEPPTERQRGEDSDDDLMAQRRAYLEMHRQELIRRMQAEMDDDDSDDENNEEDDDEPDYEVLISAEEESDTMPDSITIQALHYCIQRQSASTSLIQRRFPIGYIQSAKIIDWMESMGFISSSNGSAPRKVLLTEERFMELYGTSSEDKKEIKNAAEYREGVGNLCAVLKKVAEEKDDETNISDEFLDEIKGVVGVELFEVYRSICYAHICAKGLTFSNGERAEFFIHHYGNVTELCDGGAISKWIQGKPGYGYKRTRKTLEKLTDGLKIRMDEREQLRIDVSDLSKLPAMYYYFYWVLESLIAW